MELFTKVVERASPAKSGADDKNSLYLQRTLDAGARIATNKKAYQIKGLFAAIPEEPRGEPFRRLRTLLVGPINQHGWQTLAVTAPRSDEGAMLTVANLGIGLASTLSQSVILVDLNLRDHHLNEMFDVKADVGLLDCLQGEVQFKEVILPTEFPNLSVVAAQGPNNTGLDESTVLSAPQVHSLVRQLVSQDPGRLVIFNMPPVLVHDGTPAFVPSVDAVLLVVREGATKKADLRKSTDHLGNANLYGTVFFGK